MGFQASDIVEFARTVLRLEGVSGVWNLPSRDHLSTTLYVLIRGFDDEGFRRRMAVRDVVEDFIDRHVGDMRDSDFGFTYQVLIDDEELGPAQIPHEAMQIAA